MWDFYQRWKNHPYKLQITCMYLCTYWWDHLNGWWLLLLWKKTPWAEATWEEGVYLPYVSQVTVHQEGGIRERTKGRELVSGMAAEAMEYHCLPACSPRSWSITVSHISQNNLPSDGIAPIVLAPPTSLNDLEITPTKLSISQSDRGIFSVRFLFPHDLCLCQVEKTTNQHQYSKIQLWGVLAAKHALAILFHQLVHSFIQ